MASSCKSEARGLPLENLTALSLLDLSNRDKAVRFSDGGVAVASRSEHIAVVGPPARNNLYVPAAVQQWLRIAKAKLDVGPAATKR